MKRYIKSSLALPAANECVPGWFFNMGEYTGSFRDLRDQLSERLLRLPFVTKVDTAGISFERDGMFEVNLDVYMEKNFDELTDNEIDAIEDCGQDIGSVDFEV